MDGQNIRGLNRLTKQQRKAIGDLSSEWGVLDSAENLISRLAFKQYHALRPGMKRPTELLELERDQDELSKRKREISAEIVELEDGIRPRRRPPGKRSNAFVQVRNMHIRRCAHRPDKDICRQLDLELAQRDLTSAGLPESWTERYGVKTYSEAYQKCRGLVQKLISAAKKSR